MKFFILGFATCYMINRHAPQITKVLDDQLAKLQLKADLIKHDNPDLQV